MEVDGVPKGERKTMVLYKERVFHFYRSYESEIVRV